MFNDNRFVEVWRKETGASESRLLDSKPDGWAWPIKNGRLHCAADSVVKPQTSDVRPAAF